MATFSVEQIEEFDNTKQKVFKLFRNGKCLYTEFTAEISKDDNLEPELDELFANIEDVANNELLPKNKYRKLHISSKLQYTPYEAKTHHLRAYMFHDSETGQVIVCGGTKGEQDEDLERVEKIIKEYSAWKLELKRENRKKRRSHEK
ncbi:MAG: hypothetical protein HY064_02470 [Bacteroidetes bacterium]|nr:hypothetical protein [Bacteroidota bacterium]